MRVDHLWTPATYPQAVHAAPEVIHTSRDPKCVLNVLHQDPLSCDQHPDDIESIRFFRAPVTVDPHARTSREFALLAIVHGFDGITELCTAACFHFDERDECIATHNKIDIAMTVAEATVHDAPAFAREPPLCDAFSEFADTLIVLGHATNVRAAPVRT